MKLCSRVSFHQKFSPPPPPYLPCPPSMDIATRGTESPMHPHHLCIYAFECNVSPAELSKCLCIYIFRFILSARQITKPKSEGQSDIHDQGGRRVSPVTPPVSMDPILVRFISLSPVRMRNKCSLKRPEMKFQPSGHGSSQTHQREAFVRNRWRK